MYLFKWYKDNASVGFNYKIKTEYFSKYPYKHKWLTKLFNKVFGQRAVHHYFIRITASNVPDLYEAEPVENYKILDGFLKDQPVESYKKVRYEFYSATQQYEVSETQYKNIDALEDIEFDFWEGIEIFFSKYYKKHEQD